MNIAHRIKTTRQKLGMTQTDLATLSNCSQQAIHLLESGNTQRPRNLIELANALNCDPIWLLFGDSEG